MVYIRYVGMAEGGKTAFDRFTEDLKQRKSGILAAFMGELVNRYPEVFDASQCHEILGASYPKYPPTDKILLDERERILIAAFNRKVLLNQQSGGFYPAYTPKDSDQRLFTDLKTKFFDLFAKNVDSRVKEFVIYYEMKTQLDEWADTLFQYALDNPVATLTNRYPLTESNLQSVIKSQAFAAPIKGKALLVLFGKDVTIEDFTAEETFLSGNSRAGKLTLDILSRLHQYEHGFGDRQLAPILEGQFPFIDLYPWIGHDNTEAAIELARDYFARMAPRIIVTFSRLVSSITASNFVHPYGLPRHVSFCAMLIL